MDDQTRLVKPDDPTILSGSDEATMLSPWSGASWSSASGEAPKLEPGAAFGPYTIGRLLGRGGMGEVYEADHIESGRRVALKLLRGRMDQRDDRARFLSEGRLAASISHPHTVYIFGSEEIAGMPVISMQLVPGGTLKDRVVERGPMSVADAVAAILDVIAGLDAAASAGILHRDIKPSNCFVDADGSVKVGDFGLSISTGARDTAGSRGGFQGTPQYAPPEQLRGEHLDVRADIYAVGATLFYLLTGRAPFDASSFPALIEMVKTAPPPAAHKVRAGIPAALSAVITRCLAKDPAGRPASYAELAKLLRPFSGSAIPARRVLRLVAGVIDSIVLSVPIALLTGSAIHISGPNMSADVNMDPWAFALSVLYFAVCEGRWRTTIGKAVCGLRVVSTSGDLTWRQAAARALIFYGPGLPLVLLGFLVSRDRLVAYLTAHVGAAVFASTGPIVATALMFVSMTRRNGLAAVHDLLTGTRVVQRRLRDLRRSAGVDASAGVDDSAALPGRRRHGTFDVTAELGAIPDGRLVEAIDAVLKRRVWLIERSADAPEVPRARRDADRVGRLHWLAGQRSPDDNWDAFEAPKGAPVDPENGASSWTAVLGWLNDLATELAAAERDGTMPALSLDRVWIRTDGRAVLLDFPAPENRTGTLFPKKSPGPILAVASNPLQLLTAVGTLALGNRSSPMPVSAVAMLDRWTKKPPASIADAQMDLAAVSMSPERVARGRRLIPFAMSAAPVALMLFSALVAMRTLNNALSPEALTMVGLLEDLDKTRDPVKQRAIETYLSGTMAPRLKDESIWKTLAGKDRSADMSRLRDLARQTAARSPSAEEIARAAQLIGPELEDARVKVSGAKSATVVFVALFLIGACMSFLGGLTSVLIRPSGFVLSALGLAVLAPSGRETSRVRAIWRLIVAWSPALVYSALLAAPRTRPLVFGVLPAAVSLVLLAAGAVWTVLRPTRGPHDIVAGTTIGVR